MGWAATIVFLRTHVDSFSFCDGAESVNIWGFFPVPKEVGWIGWVCLERWHGINSTSLVKGALELLNSKNAKQEEDEEHKYDGIT